MTVKIQQYDRVIKRLTETEYPETQALIQVYGVGQLLFPTLATSANDHVTKRSTGTAGNMRRRWICSHRAPPTSSADAHRNRTHRGIHSDIRRT